MKKENCKQVKVGWFESLDKMDYSTGIVLEINGKKKLTIDFESPSNDSIEMNRCVNANFHFYSILATLTSKEAFKFVEFCMNCKNNSNRDNYSSSVFMHDAINFLKDKGKMNEVEWKEVLEKLNDINSDDPDHIKRVKKDLRIEKCQTADIGWYQASDDITQVGIVIILNQKKKVVIEFGSSKLAEIKSPNRLVSMGSYNELGSVFQSALAADLSETELLDMVEFCMADRESLSSLMFLQLVIDFLFNKKYIGLNEKQNVLDKLEDITSNEPLYIKEVRKRMRKKQIKRAEIGWYHAENRENFGVVLIMKGSWELAIEYKTSTNFVCESIIESENGLVKMGSFSTSGSFQSSFLAILTERDLLEFVEYCMTYDEKKSNRANSSMTFLSDTIKFLHQNYGAINEDEMENCLDKVNEAVDNEPELVTKVRTEIKKNEAEKFQIGWYHKKDIVKHTGIVIVMDGKKKLTVDFETLEGEEMNAVFLNTTNSSVKMGYYEDSYIYKGNLTPVTKPRLIKLLHYCSAYAKDHAYHLEKHNCRAFVLNAVHHLRDNIQPILNQKMDNFLDEINKIIQDDGFKIALVKVLKSTLQLDVKSF